ncbi:glycosyltransferase family 117 protein [Williamwhitmania taraxaci]|uniref:DUF2723 domain-containing protein n=1 Tax=Williamwhitmania taraxaci TaxID=1640674 RepID=A0A1G6GZE4_9BACT|nr:DUF2723 domain-containing protein [Williamwhitmania taraxaci]SDB87268.1 Protein of unknown function [Williamwhitmania taraxaci]
MRQFKLANIIVGWVIFAIASITYLLTIEPTTSYWDCGEFIATAFKLEVGHPPGAPLFMILGRVASLFAPDPTLVPAMINSMSALASGFTILFLFWTITHLARKIVLKGDEEPTLWQLVSIIGSGVVGALAFTFSDSFWFSAVEAEVYALSSLFTAIAFWAILKWENEADQPRANRWIIFIAYMMGLSIGVHLLNLLTIPALVFVYYFKKFKISPWGIVGAASLSVVILGGILYGIIPWVVKIAAGFDLFFVNSLGLPFNFGAIFYAILLISLLIWGVYYTHKKGKVIANTIVLAISVIIIGYSSFAMIVIRSSANPPIDEGSPDNVYSLLHYLNREQYGDRPLFKGQFYNAPAINSEERTSYIPINGKYVESYLGSDYTFDPRFTTIFPRMYSSQKEHVQEYISWANITGTPISVDNGEKAQTVYRPTFGENLTFFLRYQVDFMYFRYFMWNFAGRQNDIQSSGEPNNGNWISGINAIDSYRLGPQENLPESMKNSKSRNVYYLLPLLLGFIGLYFQFKKTKNDFGVVMMLFILTGLAIVIYLNQTPLQPRERDYAYTGSFYAFAIWIGLGVLGIAELIGKILKNRAVAVTSSIIICMLAVPTVMAFQNWDDHDRSNRYTAHDFAANYLNSCAPNAILFTNGDNDTFPLWYAQEVEGIRTDVRIVNLSLLGTDWYIGQMKRQLYYTQPGPPDKSSINPEMNQKQLFESKAVPFSLPFEKYVQGTNEMIPVIEKVKGFFDVKDIVGFIASKDEATKVQTRSGEVLDYIPTRNLAIKVDVDKVIKNGTVRPEDRDLVDSILSFTLPEKKDYLNKPEMMVLDMLAHFNWDRPIYFVSPASDVDLGLQQYLQLDGFAYRLVPIRTKPADFMSVGRIDTDTLYNKYMNKFTWGGLGNPKTYIDYNNVRTVQVVRLRKNFSRLADALSAQGKYDSARVVMTRCIEITPNYQIPYEIYTLDNIRSMYLAKDPKSANTITKEFAKIASDNLAYIMTLSPRYKNLYDYQVQLNLHYYTEMSRMAREFGQTELADKLEKEFQSRFSSYMQ